MRVRSIAHSIRTHTMRSYSASVIVGKFVKTSNCANNQTMNSLETFYSYVTCNIDSSFYIIY